MCNQALGLGYQRLVRTVVLVLLRKCVGVFILDPAAIPSRSPRSLNGDKTWETMFLSFGVHDISAMSKLMCQSLYGSGCMAVGVEWGPDTGELKRRVNIAQQSFKFGVC